MATNSNPDLNNFINQLKGKTDGIKTFEGNIRTQLESIDKSIEDLYDDTIKNQLGGDPKIIVGDKLDYIKLEIEREKANPNSKLKTDLDKVIDQQLESSKVKREELAQKSVKFLKMQAEQYAKNKEIIEDFKKAIEETQVQIDKKDEEIKTLEEYINESKDKISDNNDEIKELEQDKAEAKTPEEEKEITEKIDALTKENDYLNNFCSQKNEDELRTLKKDKNTLETTPPYSQKPLIKDLTDENEKMNESFDITCRELQKKFAEYDIDLNAELYNINNERTSEEKTEKSKDSAKGGTAAVGQPNNNIELPTVSQRAIIQNYMSLPTEERQELLSKYGYAQLDAAIQNFSRGKDKLNWGERKELHEKLEIDKKAIYDKSYAKNKNLSADVKRVASIMGVNLSDKQISNIYEDRNILENIRKIKQENIDLIQKISTNFYKKMEKGELSQKDIEEYNDYIGNPIKFGLINNSAEELNFYTPFGMAGKAIRGVRDFFSSSSKHVSDLRNTIVSKETQLHENELTKHNNSFAVKLHNLTNPGDSRYSPPKEISGSEQKAKDRIPSR